MAVRYQFLNGRKLEDLKLQQLKDESEAFTRWALKQDNLPNAEKHAFKKAFNTIISLRSGGFVCSPRDEEAAVKLLEEGINFSEKKWAHDHRTNNKHHGPNKGGRG